MENSEKPISPFYPKIPHDGESDNGYLGLTKREYFAAIAMQGLLAQGTWKDIPERKTLLECAIKMSDELLKQLEK